MSIDCNLVSKFANLRETVRYNGIQIDPTNIRSSFTKGSNRWNEVGLNEEGCSNLIGEFGYTLGYIGLIMHVIADICG